MKTIYQTQKAERIVFHFNKAYLSDPSIPMWIVKCKGTTYYVHQLQSTIGFHTKETPENEATKGSIQFKGNLTITEDESGIVEASVGVR